MELPMIKLIITLFMTGVCFINTVNATQSPIKLHTHLISYSSEPCNNFCIQIRRDNSIPVTLPITQHNQGSITISNVSAPFSFSTTWSDAEETELLSLESGETSLSDIQEFQFNITDINGTAPQNCHIDLKGKGTLYVGEVITFILSQKNGQFSCIVA
jgi:hypothetical protein